MSVFEAREVLPKPPRYGRLVGDVVVTLLGTVIEPYQAVFLYTAIGVESTVHGNDDARDESR